MAESQSQTGSENIGYEYHTRTQQYHSCGESKVIGTFDVLVMNREFEDSRRYQLPNLQAKI